MVVAFEHHGTPPCACIRLHQHFMHRDREGVPVWAKVIELVLPIFVQATPFKELCPLSTAHTSIITLSGVTKCTSKQLVREYKPEGGIRGIQDVTQPVILLFSKCPVPTGIPFLFSVPEGGQGNKEGIAPLPAVVILLQAQCIWKLDLLVSSVETVVGLRVCKVLLSCLSSPHRPRSQLNPPAIVPAILSFMVTIDEKERQTAASC
mmetsp:Transcript_71642/g.164183  ORF Transcript_71642/g.164183 Transcript_71642/m.164183 type:complete len:206 (+) Transcript_71642:479-1096(+)